MGEMVWSQGRSSYLSGPVPRDTDLSDTLYCALWGLASQYGQLGSIPPPPFLSVSPGEHAKWRCDDPPQKGYLSKRVRYPLCVAILKGYWGVWGLFLALVR